MNDQALEILLVRIESIARYADSVCDNASCRILGSDFDLSQLTQKQVHLFFGESFARLEMAETALGHIYVELLKLRNEYKGESE